MPSIPNTENTSSPGDSSSLTTISSSSFESSEPSSRAVEEIRSNDQKAYIFDGHCNNQSDVDASNTEVNQSVNKTNGVDSSGESEPCFESSSENLPHSSPRPQVTRIPAVTLCETATTDRSKSTDKSAVRRVQSVKYSRKPAMRSEERPVAIPRRSNSTYRSNNQCTSTEMNNHQPRAATFTSLQLSSFDHQDPIQKFHQRYYDKLLQYIELVQNYFPFPVAVSYQHPSKSGRRWQSVRSDFVWFVNQYDYLSFDRTTLDGEDSHGQSERRELHLHFACSIRHPQCMYRGDSLKSCFDLKTKQTLLWLHLLVLWNQSRYGKAISTNHPAMLPLRHLWSIIKSIPFESPQERQMRLRSLDRPRSACESTNHTSSVASTVQPRIQPSSKPHLWNLSRNNSKTGLGKVNSFFLLATRGYPNMRECERLIRELHAGQLFESFVRHEPIHMHHLSGQPNQSHGNRPKGLQSFPVRRWHGWCCAMCKHTLSSPGNRQFTHNAPLARRESESESVDDIRRTISICRNPSSWIPHMTGLLRSRHLKNVPKALSWLSPWQLNEFILHGTLFGWHRWVGWTTQRTEKEDSREKTQIECRLEHEPEAAYQILQRAVTRERNSNDEEYDRDWTVLDVSSIRTIQGRRKNRIGALVQLVIETEHHGVLLLRLSDSRSSRRGPGRAHNYDSPTIQPRPITYTHCNELILWFHCLQSAMNSAKQGSCRC